jgi:transcriptional accessory protein Tex/SPT6
MSFARWLHAKRSHLPIRAIEAVATLKAEGATLPFIARYRREQVCNLDEVGIMDIMEAQSEWQALTKRRAFILAEIESQNKLTDSLRELINGAQDSNLLEDIYLPFKPKRTTKATKAREAGLDPYAEALWDMAHGCRSRNTLYSHSTNLNSLQRLFHPKVTTPMPALDMDEGAKNIISQRVAEDKQVRAKVWIFIVKSKIYPLLVSTI